MNNIKLFNNDCLEEMKNIEDKSIDLIFTDLPYGETSCSWDSCIDLELMWKQFKRIRKDTTPIIFTCSTKFGYSLIESNKKEFRYDMVWIKGHTGYCCEKCNYEKKPKISKSGFLNSKRLPLKSHEMVYVFYKKCPSEVYGNNIKKYHKHKFLDDKYIDKNNKNKNTLYGKVKKQLEHPREATYNPPLPNSIIKEDDNKRPTDTYKNNSDIYGKIDRPDFKRKNNESMYDPPLPNSIIKEDNKDYDTLYGNINIPKHKEDKKNDRSRWNPPLPNSILEIASQKGKHSTQKPTQLSDFFIKYYSNENDIVLDCCMGSGSTGLSCKNLNRRFIGIEKNEEIFNIAKDRLNQ